MSTHDSVKTVSNVKLSVGRRNFLPEILPANRDKWLAGVRGWSSDLILDPLHRPRIGTFHGERPTVYTGRLPSRSLLWCSTWPFPVWKRNKNSLTWFGIWVDDPPRAFAGPFILNAHKTIVQRQVMSNRVLQINPNNLW